METNEKTVIAPAPPITLPKDQYGHLGAPTEWWWYIGTLYAANGNKYGFEINACGVNESTITYAFTQIEITDVKNQRNYQRVNPIVPLPEKWAEYDSTKKWHVKLDGPPSDPYNGNVYLSAIAGNPLNMHVEAMFRDKNGTTCKLVLDFFQQGPPLLVWGTGSKMVNPEGKTPLEQYNFYYSLTHLKTSGVITIDSEEIPVTGLTWMDHEYGEFGNGSGQGVLWTLQDIQLPNGIHLSNFTEPGVLPKENVPMPSGATLLINGKSTWVKSITTPMAPTITSEKNKTYFLKYKIEIDCPELKNATFYVNSLFPDQILKAPTGPDVYEGVASCHASFGSPQVVIDCDAWLEQSLG